MMKNRTAEKRIEVITNYFHAVDARDLEAIPVLLDQEAEIFFPQSGLLNELDQFNKLTLDLYRISRKNCCRRHHLFPKG